MRNVVPLLFLLAAAIAQSPPVPAPAAGTPKPVENPVAVITTSMGEIRVRLFLDEAPKTVENFLGLAEGTKEWKDATGATVVKPFYDGLTFHRVIKDFMIQGGCPKGDGTGDPGYKFDDEMNAKSFGFDRVKVLENGQPGHATLHIASRDDLAQNVVLPLYAKMGIKSQAELDKRTEEVERKLATLTVMEALENLGYVFSDAHPSHEPKKGSLAMANSGPNSNGCQFFINLADTPFLTGRHTVFGEVIEGMDVVEAIGNVKIGPESRPIAEVKIVSIRRLSAEEAAKPTAPPKPPGK